MDIDRFRGRIPEIITIFDRKQSQHPNDPEKNVTETAVGTGVPIIAILHFIGETHGYEPWVDEMINRIVDFYAYKNIQGIRRKSLTD